MVAVNWQYTADANEFISVYMLLHHTPISEYSD